MSLLRTWQALQHRLAPIIQSNIYVRIARASWGLVPVPTAGHDTERELGYLFIRANGLRLAWVPGLSHPLVSVHRLGFYVLDEAAHDRSTPQEKGLQTHIHFVPWQDVPRPELVRLTLWLWHQLDDQTDHNALTPAQLEVAHERELLQRFTDAEQNQASMSLSHHDVRAMMRWIRRHESLDPDVYRIVFNVAEDSRDWHGIVSLNQGERRLATTECGPSTWAELLATATSQLSHLPGVTTVVPFSTWAHEHLRTVVSRLYVRLDANEPVYIRHEYAPA